MPNIDIKPTARMLEEIEILLSKYIDCQDSDDAGLLIAGSSVLALLTKNFIPNDIDIFIVGDYLEYMELKNGYIPIKINDITKKVEPNQPEYIGDGSQCYIPNSNVNYIFHYDTPKDAMKNFDLSLCQCGLFYVPFTKQWRFVASPQCLMDIDMKIIRILRKQYATIENKEARLDKYKVRFPDWKVVEGNSIWSSLEWQYQ